MITKAVVLRSTSVTPEIEELEIPALKSGQVLIKMAYSGICHTQISEIRGLRGEDRFLPHVLGHEGSGVVADIGPDVTKVGIGDTVVVSWIKGSGRDVPSNQYESKTGNVNAGAVSSFMEYAVVSENRITPIPIEMPLCEASLLGCAIPTGAGTVLNNNLVTPGSSIAVFGVGGIGLGAIIAAVASGAGKIIAIDIEDSKLALAQQLGATDLIHAVKQDPLVEIGRITNGGGVDCALEAVGKIATMELAFASVREWGGLAVLAGNPPFGETVRLNPYDLIRGKRIIGTAGGESNPDRDIPKYVELFLQGKLPLAKIITDVFPFARFAEALACMEQGKAGRVLLEF
jgi:S-(hydroxymethyl)glutathione dehydrogenase/alcohol dehydrogenase